MKQPFNILITCAGGLLASKVLPYIRNSYPDCRIIGTDMKANPDTTEKFDHLFHIPHSSQEGFIEALTNIVKEHNVKLIIPWSDEEVHNLLSKREFFKSMGCSIALPSLEAFEIMSDKGRTYKFLQQYNIPGPEFKIINSPNALSIALTNFLKTHSTAVIKPCKSRGGRDVFVIGNDLDQTHFNENRISAMTADEFLESFLEKISFSETDWLVMERMIAPAYDIDVLFWENTVHAVIPRLRHNPEGLPYKGYTIEKNRPLDKIASQVARSLKTSHLYDVDVMMGADGNLKVMEINPRPSGSIFCSHIAGHELFCDLIELHVFGETQQRQVLDEFIIKAPL